MGFPSKYNEFIESANVSSHVRPRSASAAIGPNGPESAAMVCAMQVRAGKSAKTSMHDKVAISDVSLPDMLQTQKGCASTNHDSLQKFCDASVASKSHGRCWFDTDSEASCSSEVEELAHGGNHPAEKAEDPEVIASCPRNFSRSPPRKYNGIATGHESSTDDRLLSFSDRNNSFQDSGSNLLVQISDQNDGGTSTVVNSFTREAFAPTVMPWFKIKRKTMHR